MTRNADDVWQLVDRRQEAYAAFSDKIWSMPELNFAEHRSAAEHAAMLRCEGFRVTERVAGIPSAVMGEAGDRGPVIAFLGEFDALPGLSQAAGVAEHRPLEQNGPGHGCGHNLLGAGSLLAAAAMKDWLAGHGLPGRVRYYGCPAEEGGAGKAFMARDGAFRDVDIAISWHPAAFSGVNPAKSLACQQIDFAFTGRASHAAVAPHLGRSALDAVELMSVGVNYLREHMPGDARIHYAYLNAGGIAPNVVQAEARVRYIVRSLGTADLLDLVERVRQVAVGAALMTGTQVQSGVISAMSNLLNNEPLSRVMHGALERLGPVRFDDADRSFARSIQGTLGVEAIASAHEKVGLDSADAPLADRIVLQGTPGTSMLGSTDVGDVSWAVPTVQLNGAAFAVGTAYHSWQLTAQGTAPAAHKGMLHAAKVMAGTAADLLLDPALLQEAKAAHQAKLARTPFVSPLPADLPAPIGMAAPA